MSVRKIHRQKQSAARSLRKAKTLRLESLEPRMLMASDFDPQYYFDTRDIGGSGETPIVGDFNGDGRADIGVYIPNAKTDARWVVKFNQGGDKFAAGAKYDIDRRDIGGAGEMPIVGDFNGDPRAEL
ncbi:MAG: FG-GAP repeat domain-containing protein, partial [Pirellulaceae bacterium]